MFDRFVSARTEKRGRRRGAMILASVGLHAIAIGGVLFWSFWKVERVSRASTQVTWAETSAPPPPPPEAAPPPPPKGAPKPTKVADAAIHQPTIKPEVPVDLPPTTNSMPTVDTPSSDPGGPAGQPDGQPDGNGDPSSNSKCTVNCTGTGGDGDGGEQQKPIKIDASQAHRIAGDEQILLPPSVKQSLMAQHTRNLAVPVRICLSSGGVPTAITPSSPFAEANAKIAHEAAAWRYEPYRVNGVAVPVCTVVLLRYQLE
jgi:hypothetical protein